MTINITFERTRRDTTQNNINKKVRELHLFHNKFDTIPRNSIKGLLYVNFNDYVRITQATSKNRENNFLHQ